MLPSVSTRRGCSPSLRAVLAPGEAKDVSSFLGLSRVQEILFVWVYASVSEEVLARGLLQSLLRPLARVRLPIGGGRHLSFPVVLSAAFFGCMHVVLSDVLGSAVVAVIVLTTLLGLVAGYYRERTGGLVPAIIVHSLFNIGGSLPNWLLG